MRRRDSGGNQNDYDVAFVEIWMVSCVAVYANYTSTGLASFPGL